jgi:hypothetical protein
VARVVIIKCDTCASSDEAEEFQITRDGETRTVAACAEHKRPLVEAFDRGEAEDRPKRGRRRNVHAVVPIEDTDIREP